MPNSRVAGEPMQNLLRAIEDPPRGVSPAASAWRPDSQFVVDGIGVAWLVQSGHVDLFLVRLQNGDPIGHRSHVLRVSEGEVVCGMGVRPDGVALLARRAPETSLKRISQHSLLATEAGTRKLEAWRDRLGGALAAFAPTHDTDICNAGFMGFHQDLSDALEAAQERFEIREQELLAAKAASASAALEHSLQALGAPLAVADAPHASRSAAPLARVCEIAAADLGTTTGPLPGIPEEGDAGVVAMAARSGLRAREVLLHGDWWKDYSGPMVAFRKNDGLPVALIRTGATGYGFQLSSGGKPAKVTKANAGEFRGAAFLFYRPFSARSLSLRDFLTFGLRGCGREIGFIVLIGIAGGLLGLAAPLAFGALFDYVIPHADRKQVGLLGALLGLSAVSAMLLRIAGGFATLRVEARIASSLQTALWDRLLSLPVSFFKSYTTGDLASRSMAVDRIQQTLTGPILTSGMAACLSSFQVGILFCFSVKFALLALALLAIAFAAGTALGVVQVHLQRKITRIQGRITGILAELLSGIAKIRVAGAEMRAFAYWAGSFSAKSREWVRARRFASVLTTFNSAFPAASLAIVYWAGLRLMPQDPGARMSTGEFLAFSASFQTLLLAALQMSSAVVSGLVIVPEYERLRPILEAAPERGPAWTEAPELAGEIEISHVTFRYRPDQPPILRDLSLRVMPGEFVAVVGESGCGKSTLLRILLGFEEPQSGTVYYDGHAMKGLNASSVRRQMGVVLQSGRLMAGSIASNIGRTLSLSPEEVLEAARLAGLEKELKEMPMGLHTMLSDGGGGLSGGQRQRVLIARAIVNRPRILLLDEATSALDNRSQALISERLACLKATRIVIAHRLSTIRSADRILVMENGEFTQSGSYEQLASQPGLLAELAARQALR